MSEHKSLKDISWLVPEHEYREDIAYSYSLLSKFNREGFTGIPHLFDKLDTPALTFGSIVDCKLTSPEEFDDRFLVVDMPTLEDSYMRVVTRLYNENKSLDLQDLSQEVILDACMKERFYLNWKPETRVKNIIEKGAYYYGLLKDSEGKKIITNELNSIADRCINELTNNPFTSYYFAVDNPFIDIERSYQLKFKGVYEHNKTSINLKCMFDLLVVDYDKKTIRPIDLKTSSHDEWDFPTSFIKWNYWIQAQLYTYLLDYNIKRDDYFKDFKILPYLFIVINRNNMAPMVWEYADNFSTEDTYYGKNNKYFCRNWRKIVVELDEYLKHPTKYPLNTEKINDITKYLYEKQDCY